MKRLDVVEGLSSILASHNKINASDLSGLIHSFKNQDDISFEDFLLEEAIVDRDELLQALSEYYQVPQCDPTGLFFDHYMMRLFPKDALLEHIMIPYEREGDTLWVIASEPDNPHLRVVLHRYITHNFSFMVALPEDIIDAIEEYYDQSDTYQPNHIANALMERSAIDVHPSNIYDEDHACQEDPNTIPCIVEKTDDDYERY